MSEPKETIEFKKEITLSFDKKTIASYIFTALTYDPVYAFVYEKSDPDKSVPDCVMSGGWVDFITEDDLDTSMYWGRGNYDRDEKGRPKIKNDATKYRLTLDDIRKALPKWVDFLIGYYKRKGHTLPISSNSIEPAFVDAIDCFNLLQLALFDEIVVG